MACLPHIFTAPRAADGSASFPSLGSGWWGAALAVAQRPMAGCGDTASLAGRGRAGQARRCPEPSSISVSVLRTALQVTEASDGLGPEGKTLKFMVQDRYPVSHRSCGDISRPFPALTDVSTCHLAPWCLRPQGAAPTQPCCPCSVPWDLCVGSWGSSGQCSLLPREPSSHGSPPSLGGCSWAWACQPTRWQRTPQPPVLPT